MFWWLVGALVLVGITLVLVLIVVGGSKLQDRHPVNRYLR